jgi:hypothetical protein
MSVFGAETTSTRYKESDCDTLKSIVRACSPEKSRGFPKPRPMAWAGITLHLRCSPLAEGKNIPDRPQI